MIDNDTRGGLSVTITDEADTLDFEMPPCGNLSYTPVDGNEVGLRIDGSDPEVAFDDRVRIPGSEELFVVVAATGDVTFPSERPQPDTC